MARWMTPTKKEVSDMKAKFKDRPRHVRAVFNRLDFFELYLLKTTGYRVKLCAIEDDGSVTVGVGHLYNDIPYSSVMFGIDPDDLEPCDLPTEDDVAVTDKSPSRVYH
jgi:hypothetical protein